MSITVADIEAARRTIAGQVLRTPMLPAPKLSALTAAEIYVKYENLQVTNSFKDRGALNKLASLSASERGRGVIAMSAGNHAQAIAYHAARLGIPATIVMPVTTPFVQVAATQAHGAEVVLEGENRALGGAALAEGIAVKNVGVSALPIVRQLVSEIILVDVAHLERAVNAYLTLQKTMAEGAGAAGVAAMLVEPEKFRGRKSGLILCGGNIDARILASVMVRELERESRIVSFRLTIPDRPGILGQIATRLGQLGANILEVDHRRLFLDVPAKGARLDVTAEIRDRAHGEEIFAALLTDGYQPIQIAAATALQ